LRVVGTVRQGPHRQAGLAPHDDRVVVFSHPRLGAARGVVVGVAGGFGFHALARLSGSQVADDGQDAPFSSRDSAMWSLVMMLPMCPSTVFGER
jgi:hypothetical protein